MSVVDLRAPGQTQAMMTRMRWVERGVFPATGWYQSPVFQADQPFNSIEVIWRADVPPGAMLSSYVRASEDGESWSDWFHVHEDSHVPPASDGRRFGMPVLLASNRFVQYRVASEANRDGQSPALAEVEIGCVDTSPPARYLADEPALIDGWIIPRAGWGADESLRFRNGKEIWPPSYRSIEKVIVHHTVTQNQEADPSATMRSIYSYHAITQGWGDIGYNFLIDWKGNVYEGRFGGPNVIGGHALQYNRGSLGIALMGTFSTTEAQQAALDSLVRLIQSRASHIDPAGRGFFIDKENVPNICGHRDVLSTECPGGRLWNRLPEIRGRLKGTDPIYFGPPSSQPTSAEIVSFRIAPNEVKAETLLRVEAVVKNTGSATIYTQGPPPGYIYDEYAAFDTAGYPKIEGCYRVCLDFVGNQGLPNRYRWGLPGPVEPGEQVTVRGFVRLRSVGKWTFSGSLVEEFLRYHQQGLGTKTINVVPPPTGPTPKISSPNLRYQTVTQHNVPEVFDRYWNANGGLERFGYPLTEPFDEVSETDGNVYLTQYFERARFEYHPEHAGTRFEVLLGLLGNETTTGRGGERPFQPLPSLPASPDYDYFPETGHTLRAGFRHYWRDHGGLPVFGYPISEEFEEVSKTDGQPHVVQYFERARFEWHPDKRGTPYEFLLGHLAREILIDRGWLQQEF